MSRNTDSEEDLRLLSLDGGDVRCVSQLWILREYMSRLSSDSGREVLPYEHFHLITAVGPASAIAVFIGVLKISIDDSIDLFTQICRDVYPTGEIGPQPRSNILRSAIESALASKGIAPSTLLTQVTDTNVVLGYVSATNIGTWRAFRNYTSRHHAYEPTIIEAICACWAMPPRFQAFTVGKEIEKLEVISASAAFPNPAPQAIQEASELYGPERRVCLLLSLGYGGSMRQNVGGDDKLVQAEVTAHELERRYGPTGVYYRLSVIPSPALPEYVSQETLGIISAHTSDYLLNPATDRALDQVVTTSSRKSRFTLKGLAQVTAPPKVSFSGLPPLSPYYVQRDTPMNRMVASFLGAEAEGCQRVQILTGMGGSGKTQLVISFIREHGERFRNVLFVDASSAKTIETGLVARLKAIDKSFQGADLDSALTALAQPNDILTTHWCIIFDNADDPKLDISNFFPVCDHGAIIITSRNTQLESISPNDHIPLEVMTREEACNALLFSAIGPKENWRPHHRQLALNIVKEFDYLPIAVIQAGCYIRKHKCLDTYLSRLEASRSEMLKHASMQRDKLRYSHSVYAAFDISLASLSERALGLLSILSYYDYTGFPRSVLALAAAKDFTHEEYRLMDREKDFEEAIALLRQIFTPHDKLEDVELDRLVDELQQSSLISLVTFYSEIKLRFHPLIHAWAYDRQSDEEKKKYHDAALRLITCVVDGNDGIDVESELGPHARRFIQEMTKLHVNDQSALVDIWETEPRDPLKLKIFEDIYQTVRASHGDSDLRTSEAHLAYCSWYADETFDFAKAEDIARQEYELRKVICGPQTAPTARAMVVLARRIAFTKTRRNEVLDLLHKALEIQKEILGPNHIDTQTTMCVLAILLHRNPAEYEEATLLLEQLLATRTSLLGADHPKTLAIEDLLIDCYAEIGDEAQGKLHELLSVRHSRYINSSTDSIAVLTFQGHMYQLQGQYEEAEVAYREVIENIRAIFGDLSSRNLGVVKALAELLEETRKFTELEELLRQYVILDYDFHGAARDHMISLATKLGEHLLKSERAAKALPILRSGYSMALNSYGKSGFGISSHRLRLAECLVLLQQYTEAETLIREQLHDWHLMELSTNLAKVYPYVLQVQCLFMQNKYAEGEALLREAYTKNKNSLAASKFYSCSTLWYLIYTLYKKGHRQRYMPFIQDMLQMYESNEDDIDIVVLTLLFTSAFLLEQQKQFAAAEDILRTRDTKCKEIFGVESPQYVFERGVLATFLFHQRRFSESRSIREDQLRRFIELDDESCAEDVKAKLREIEEALKDENLDSEWLIISNF
ncbi:hypothetical protein PIIN_08006 [Serendipita indica DSM 11827]|uniref:Uncharacterized protein n=1 Tax=Serendipita indica (strain DSM 11827) TaxID=1109443 RepID=G4TRV9_SERID|nr:hypothetical protein PIIN_08006 [Serendipita indica DSM 11827]